jgi:GT2 family glycosyltransferase
MPEPLVSIGLVTWNSAVHLPGCLRALVRQEYPNFEFIVVDNASTDHSLDLVIQYYPGANVIRNVDNTGFCHAHNQAIQASKGPYYMPLNPDVEMEKGYILNLVQALEALKEYGSAAGKLLLKPRNEYPHRIDSTGLFLDRRRRQYLRGYGELDQGQYDHPGEVFGVDGAAPLYRREMLEDIKIEEQYFDESFFAHKEDVDLAWRARLLGWKCFYQPLAVAYHQHTFKPNQRNVILPSIRVEAVKNRYLLLIKNETALGWRRDWFPILWYDLKILVYICLFERTSLKAMSLLKNAWPQALVKRREIARRIRVQPADILVWFK